jgi:hypothetical protein
MPDDGPVTILLWLLPAALATLAAMVVVSWVGRQRPARERTEAEQERFAAAIARPLPQAARPRPARRERSTGVAPRKSA